MRTVRVVNFRSDGIAKLLKDYDMEDEFWDEYYDGEPYMEFYIFPDDEDGLYTNAVTIAIRNHLIDLGCYECEDVLIMFNE